MCKMGLIFSIPLTDKIVCPNLRIDDWLGKDKWRRGGVATQRIANPCTPVRIRTAPLNKRIGRQTLLAAHAADFFGFPPYSFLGGASACPATSHAPAWRFRRILITGRRSLSNAASCSCQYKSRIAVVFASDREIVG